MPEWVTVGLAWLTDDGVAKAGLVLAIIGLLWNLRQDRARRPKLAISFIKAEKMRFEEWEMVLDSKYTSALDLRLSNTSEEVPLTVIELGYRRVGSRQRTPCAYLSGPVHSGHNMSWRDTSVPLTLLASEAVRVTLLTVDLCSSTDLDGLYARCSRGRVSWLPDRELRTLTETHLWPSPESPSP